MQALNLNHAFTLIEPGPVVLVTTHDGGKDNIMTISCWTMVMDLKPVYAITTGAGVELGQATAYQSPATPGTHGQIT